MKQSKATGNVLTVELKSPNFLLNRLKTDQFTAKSAGQKEDQKGILTDNLKQKNRPRGGFFVFLYFILLYFFSYFLYEIVEKIKIVKS